MEIETKGVGVGGEVRVNFSSVLYLDDMRVPLDRRIKVVRNYHEFVDYLRTHEMPELVAYDHDLSEEHYPSVAEDIPGREIPYHTYIKKTGLDCARYVVGQRLPIRYWTVHSWNPVGRANIEKVLRAYCPQGALYGLEIPFRSVEREVYGGLIKGGYRSSPVD